MALRHQAITVEAQPQMAWPFAIAASAGRLLLEGLRARAAALETSGSRRPSSPAPWASWFLR